MARENGEQRLLALVLYATAKLSLTLSKTPQYGPHPPPPPSYDHDGHRLTTTA
jgi:hypothetical protein